MLSSKNPSAQEITHALTDYFTKAGARLEPPRSLSYNEEGGSIVYRPKAGWNYNPKSGSLVIRATAQEFEILEQAVRLLNAMPVPHIKIETRFVELTQPDTQALGFDWFLGNLIMKDRVFTNSARTPKQIYGILSDPQYRVVLRAFEQGSGVDLLAAPSVTTLSGRQAQVQVADSRTVVTGLNPQALLPPGIADDASQLYQTSEMRFGPVLDVTPHLSADGYTISLSVTASVTEFLGYAENSNSISGYVNGQRKQVALPLPKFRSRELTATANVFDGQTIVLENTLEFVTSAKPNGETEAQEIVGSNKKPLLVFVTASLVDEAGNRIHGNGELPFAADSIPPQPPSQK